MSESLDLSIGELGVLDQPERGALTLTDSFRSRP